MQPKSGKFTLTQWLRAFVWELRARKANHRDSETCINDPGAWFDADHYRTQYPGMASCSREALLHHYRAAGWQVSSSPHYLFDPDYYRRSCARAGLTLHGNPIDHWLSAGQLHLLAPSPLDSLLTWLHQQPSNDHNLASLSLAQLHPWGAVAETVTTDFSESRTLLAAWIEQNQLNPEAFIALRALPADPLPSCTWPIGPEEKKPLENSGQPWRAVVLGGSPHDWQVHALLQHLPCHLDPEQALWCEHWPAPENSDTRDLPLLVLHLQPLELTNQQGLLPAMVGKTVLDCRPEQVQVLRRLGVNAHTISALTPLRYKLRKALTAQAVSSLGLPSPAALAAIGAPDTPAPLCLGSTGPLWERSLDSSCWCLPAFHAQQPTSPAGARQLAAWLQACQLAGVQLVELAAPANPLHFDGFMALAEPEPQPTGWLPVQRFEFEITTAELMNELEWRRKGCPAPPPCSTPAPLQACLWKHRHETPIAAVCISLFDYSDKIVKALESVHSQTLELLELVVVDDASNDAGAAVVHAWLEQHGHRFVRALLMRHTSNGGLASARNSAFAAAEAPWCFVLDADNALHPEAVQRCLTIAQAASPNIAVVHPLIHSVDNRHLQTDKNDSAHQNTNPPKGLLSSYSWQKHLFNHGNYIDAMALVRKDAWEEVGGYTHIPGGWEDYDFWCKLMGAGLNGVLCPQALASYSMHGSSMTDSTTALCQRQLSRLLQQRHPWLELPMALEADTHKIIN